MGEAVGAPDGAQLGRAVEDEGSKPEPPEVPEAEAEDDEDGSGDGQPRDGWLAAEEARRLRYREQTVRLGVLSRLVRSTTGAIADVEHFDASLHADAVERVLENCDKVLSLVRRQISDIVSEGWPEAPDAEEGSL